MAGARKFWRTQLGGGELRNLFWKGVGGSSVSWAGQCSGSGFEVVEVVIAPARRERSHGIVSGAGLGRFSGQLNGRWSGIGFGVVWAGLGLVCLPTLILARSSFLFILVRFHSPWYHEERRMRAYERC